MRKLESKSWSVDNGHFPYSKLSPLRYLSFGIPLSLPRLLNSLSPCIYSNFPPLTTLLRYSGSGLTTPMQTPALLTAPSFPATMSCTNSATCTLSWVGPTNTKLVDPASPRSQYPQANSHIGAPSCVVVWSFSSTETHSFSITFSSTTHSALGDGSS